MRVITRFAERPIEKVSGCFVAGFGIGQHDIPHLVILLEHADRTLEKRLCERRIDDIGRVVAQHLSHVIVDDIAVHLLEADHVLFAEARTMALVE